MPDSSSGLYYRNIIGTKGLRLLNIKSTKKNSKGRYLQYTNETEGNPNLNSLNAAEAYEYRVPNYASWTKLQGPLPRINEENAKIIANIHQASAPNYKYETMKKLLRSRQGLNRTRKNKLSKRLRVLYASNNNDE